jgi:hypothetical protein
LEVAVGPASFSEEGLSESDHVDEPKPKFPIHEGSRNAKLACCFEDSGIPIVPACPQSFVDTEMLLEQHAYSNLHLPNHAGLLEPYGQDKCLLETEDIDFEFVYALHTFVATVEGQANATKGDTMVLLDDSNSYWWLVRVVKDSSIGKMLQYKSLLYSCTDVHPFRLSSCRTHRDTH